VLWLCYVIPIKFLSCSDPCADSHLYMSSIEIVFRRLCMNTVYADWLSGCPNRLRYGSCLSIHSSVCLFCPALNSGRERHRKAKTGAKVPQGWIDQCANFRFKRSKVEVTGCQKPPENDTSRVNSAWPSFVQTFGNVKVALRLKFKISECCACVQGPHLVSTVWQYLCLYLILFLCYIILCSLSCWRLS